MKPINVYSENTELPKGVKVVTYAENQPEYQPLPCVRLPSGDIATKWELTQAERDEIDRTGCFYLVVSTHNSPLQPLMPMADEPGITGDEKLFFYSPMQWREDQGIQEEWQDIGLPMGFRDAIYTDTQIHFGFWDRLKILFGFRVRVEAKTFTEERPGKCLTESEVHVFRDRPLPEGWGVVEAGEAKNAGN